MKNLESKHYETDSIEIRCCKCNMKLMEYTLQHDDDALAINGMSFKCSRCRRAITLMKYTEAIMKQGNVLAHDKSAKKYILIGARCTAKYQSLREKLTNGNSEFFLQIVFI